MPAVCQCKAAAAGPRLESCSTNRSVCTSLPAPGLWCAAPALPLWDPTPLLTQPLTVCNCWVSWFRVPSQLKNNSTKKKQKVANFEPVQVHEPVPSAILTSTRKEEKEGAGKVGGPIFISLGCCGNTQTPPHFKFQLACTAECDYFNQFFPKIKPYSNLCRSLSSHSLLGHKKQEVRPVHYMNHFYPSYSIQQRGSIRFSNLIIVLPDNCFKHH